MLQSFPGRQSAVTTMGLGKSLAQPNTQAMNSHKSFHLPSNTHSFGVELRKWAPTTIVAVVEARELLRSLIQVDDGRESLVFLCCGQSPYITSAAATAALLG